MSPQHAIRRFRSTEAEIEENIRLNAIQKERDRQAQQPTPKAPERDKVTRGSKGHEIENLKRLLADVSKRLDKLK